MTELRKRMIECLQLRGLSERTQESYVRAVRQLAEHYHKSPDLITEEELRQYFLYLKNVKHYSRSTATIAICGIKFFFCLYSGGAQPPHILEHGRDIALIKLGHALTAPAQAFRSRWPIDELAQIS